MKLDQALLMVLFFLGSGAAIGMVVRSGVVEVPVLTNIARNSRQVADLAPEAWPPRTGAPFPEMKLTGLSGNPIKLGDLRGRVLLIESIAMSCAACQSFSGANDGPGPFGADGDAQADLQSLEHYVRRFADTDFDDPRMTYVQVLFYNGSSSGPPTVAEARAWAEHFGLNRPNVVVAVADTDYLCKQTQGMIPGFFLVDREFQLRCHAGKNPYKNLYADLLPALKELLKDEANAGSEPAPEATGEEATGEEATGEEATGEEARNESQGRS